MITKEYVQGLQNQVSALVEKAAEYFEVGGGEPNVSQQRTNADMAFFASLMHLKGYVEVLNPESFPPQTKQ